LKKLLSSGDAMAGNSPALFDAEALLDAAEQRAMWSRFGL
jgi:acyl-CoA reductase-like NAD-dependent aldehyde dehydrogenase